MPHYGTLTDPVRCPCGGDAQLLRLCISEQLFAINLPGNELKHAPSCRHFDVSNISIPNGHNWTIASSMYGVLLPHLNLDQTLPGLAHLTNRPPSTQSMNLRQLAYCIWKAAGLNRVWSNNWRKLPWNDVADLLHATAGLYTLNGSVLQNVLHVSHERGRPLSSALALQEKIDALEQKANEHATPRILVAGVIKQYKSAKYGCSIVIKGMEVIEFLLDSKLSSTLTRRNGYELLGIGRYSTDSVLALLQVERRSGAYAVVDATLMRFSDEWMPVYCEEIQGLLNKLRSDGARVICPGPTCMTDGVPYLLTSFNSSLDKVVRVNAQKYIPGAGYWDHGSRTLHF